MKLVTQVLGPTFRRSLGVNANRPSAKSRAQSKLTEIKTPVTPPLLEGFEEIDLTDDCDKISQQKPLKIKSLKSAFLKVGFLALKAVIVLLYILTAPLLLLFAILSLITSPVGGFFSLMALAIEQANKAYNRT